MFNLAVKKFFEKNLPLKVYGNLNYYKCNLLSIQKSEIRSRLKCLNIAFFWPFIPFKFTARRHDVLWLFGSRESFVLKNWATMTRHKIQNGGAQEI